MKQRREAALREPPKPKPGVARGPRGQAISMKTLIDEGLLWPGENVLSVDYKQTTTLATLTPEGRIFCHIGGQDKYFDSPSAFSIYLKRLVNPGRKADDGWKTVKFDNRYLEAYKLDLAMRRYPQGAPGAPAPAPAATRPRAPARARAAKYDSDEETEAETESESEPEDEEPPYADDDEDDEAGYEPKPRPTKRARGAASAATSQPAPAPQRSPAQPKQPQQQPQHHAVGLDDSEQPRFIVRGRPCPAAIRAYEDALKKRHTSAAALANNGGLPRGPVFVPHTAPTAPPENVTAAFDRPRREVRAPQHRGNTLDEHQMVACEEYKGAAGSGLPGSQPFRVHVAHAVLALMDFHAHLCDHEIIGLLGGTFDTATRDMRVLRAFPVRELAEGGGLIDVEMDPVDESQVRATIRDVHNMQCVGWYHSHPTFAAMPSVIDISNQGRQQVAHRDEASDDGGAVLEPYIAAIVAPYVRTSTPLQSQMSWFRVEHPSGRLPPAEDLVAAGCKPVRVEVAVHPVNPASPQDLHLRGMPTAELKELACRYADKAHRVELDHEWRDGISCADKLQTTLAARLPSVWPDADVRPWTMQAASGALRAWDEATAGITPVVTDAAWDSGQQPPLVLDQDPQHQHPPVSQPALENGGADGSAAAWQVQQQQQQHEPPLVLPPLDAPPPLQ